MTRGVQPGEQGRRSWCQGFRSLQFTISLLVVLLTMGVTVAGVVLSMRATSNALYANEFKRTRDWSSMVATAAAPAIIDGDRESLVTMANRLISSQGVAYVVFADKNGKVLASAESCAGLTSAVTTNAGAMLDVDYPHRLSPRHFSSQGITAIDITVPVFGNDLLRRVGQTSPVIVGYLRFAPDVTETQAKLNLIGRQLFRLATWMLLLVVPCSLLLTRYLVAPLDELARTARAIAAGALDARAKVSSRNEIGELANSFNRMADRVTATQLELLELNADLEDRVAQRTRELRDLASRDPLTSLYNRRHFSEVMNHEFAAAQRYGKDLTCLMFDVDHFKQINDHHGHRVGDGILIALANAIRGELRQADVAARFGGDEFIVLLPETHASQASVLTDRICQRFGTEVEASYPGIRPTLSIGVASLSNTESPTAEALIHEADLALYAAKNGGRNRSFEAGHPVATGA